MSAQDYTVDASAVGCCRGAHVWGSPDGAVPQDGRQVTCRVCPATARAKAETPARAGRTPGQEKTCEASGRFTSSDPIVAFLYDLMKLHLPTGDVAKLVYDAARISGANSCEYTNGWLAQYAAHLSATLRAPAVLVETPEKRETSAAPEPQCNCGDPECGGCYPS